MRIHYILDEGLPIPMQTGTGQDTVASLQSAIKLLVKSKEVMACDVDKIEVYPLGVTKQDYEGATPLKPEDPLPSGSCKENGIFCHVPRDKQNLQPERKKLVATGGVTFTKKKKKSARLSAVAKKVASDDEGPPPAPKREYRDSYVGGQHLTDAEKCDIPKFTCYYQLGESVPYYIEVQGWEASVGRLKERILETRGNRGLCPDLWGVTNISMFQIFPPGWHNGKPKHPEMVDYDADIPPISSLKEPFIIPAVRDNSEEVSAKADLAKLKAKKKRKSSKAVKAVKPKKEEPKAITVQVKTPDGTLIPVELKPSDTIEFIKEKVAPEAGVEVQEQVLKLGDTELPDEKTANAMGLQDGDVLELPPGGITVHVNTPDGSAITLQLQPSDSIQSIKEAIAEPTGIDVPKQILKFNEEDLPNEETAEAMGLQDGSVLDLEAPITVQVRTPDGDIMEVEMNPSDPVRFIKETVGPELGMEVPEQVLLFEDQVLPNNETANAMGLKDGSIIDMQPAEPDPITIQVKTPDGKLIPVEVKPTDTIESIKEAIAPEAGIEVPEQVLTYNDNELPNGETTDDMGLQDGSIIDLEPPPITVHVRTPDGGTISIQMQPSDTIESIKEAVAPAAGIEVPEQVMKFEGVELPDDKTADDMGLKDGSVIDLEPKGMTVHVRTPDGSTISVQLMPSDTIESIKEAVAPETGIDVPEQVLTFGDEELPDEETVEAMGLKDGDVIDLEQKGLTVHVNTPDGNTISVQLKPFDTIESIKEAIAPEAGIEVPEQVLTFGDTELPDEETVDAMGLKDGDVLDLEPRGMTVHVNTPDGNTISVQLKPSDTIESIKEAIAPEAGIEVPEQVLTFGDTELPDEETVSAMGLNDGDVIDLEPKGMTVHVNTPDGSTISVQLKPSDTIESIKEAVAPETGIDVPEQVLTFGDTELPDKETVGNMGLKDGDVLDLEQKGMTVHVNTPDGNTISVQLKPFDTIQSIKEAIAPEADIEVPEQVLTFGESELPDEETVGGVGLKDGDVLDLEPKGMTVHVNTPDGNTISVQLKPSDTIESIKEAIAPEAGIEVPEQVLKLGDTELPDKETVGDMGLKDGSVIDLAPTGITVNVNCPDGTTISVQMQPSDTIENIKKAIATPAGIEVPEQVLKFEGTELPDGETAEAMGLKDGCFVDLEAKAAPEGKEKKPKKEKKKKKKSKDKDWDGDKSKGYKHDFQGAPLDLTRHKAHFMVGDQVPMEMICPAQMTIFGFKEEVLRMRDTGSALVKRYFEGVDDPNQVKIFAAGSWGEGDPLPDDILVPRNSSPYAMFSVMK